MIWPLYSVRAPAGLLMIAVLRLAGAGRISAVESVVARRVPALSIGAGAAMGPVAVDPFTHSYPIPGAVWCGRFERLGGARRIDEPGDRATCNAERVRVTGIPSAIRVSLDFQALRRKAPALLNVRSIRMEKLVIRPSGARAVEGCSAVSLAVT